MSCSLPSGFVYLRDIDSTILQSVRYASQENFIGYPLVGYEVPTIILSEECATALKRVQDSFKAIGYSLVVYDGYRPQRTVDYFIKWSEDITDQLNKAKYYQQTAKADVFHLDYLGKKSGHSRGSTVDVSLIGLGNAIHEVILSNRILRNGESIPFLDDGTLDMGSSFDLFHDVSHPGTTLLDTAYMERRDMLSKMMKQHGFIGLRTEWWHYTLANEPFPDTYFDFLVR